MSTAAVIIFLVTYAGVAVGSFPGLTLDRTGIALIGAICMVVGGVLKTPEALHAIDASTILLLYALMVISAHFRLCGFYTYMARIITRQMENPAKFLFVLMLVSALLSAFLANDIVCLAFTSVLCVAVSNARLNPFPFLIGLAASSNIGSAATIIGNPQNMLLGQVGKLNFAHFSLYCIVPAAVSLIGAFFIILLLYRWKFHLPQAKNIDRKPQDWPDYNPWQSTKGIIIVMILVALFFTKVPRELSAIALAGVILCSRTMHSRSMLALVDWHLITLFCSLFIVIAGIEVTGLPQRVMNDLANRGINPTNPFNLIVLTTFLSNIVSNVPAVMLLVKFLDPQNPAMWYITALASTFAGNLVTIGSIANLIVIEGARGCGINLTFKEHARAGIPITLFSILVTLVWVWLY